MPDRIVIGMMAAVFLTLGGSGAKAQTPGKQEGKSFKKEIVKTVTVQYLLYLPKEYGKDPAAKFPLILFLHGAGERGADLEKVKAHGPPRLAAEGKELPFIIVSPQCPERQFWSHEALNALLEEIIAQYNVDQDRIYLTGLSMGGYGTWEMAMAYPDRFAALVPICGGGDPGGVEKIKHLPIWVFHGAKDKAVPLSESQKMVDALKALKADVQFTVYPELEHDCWTETYNNRALYEWLLKQKRKPRL